jgi:tetratricopeptide (TPR) repeat protein
MAIAAVVHGAPCSFERARPAELEQMGRNVLLVDGIMQGVPYPGAENPREMPRTSLADFRNGVQKKIRSAKVDWLFFAFQSDKYYSNDSSVISAGADIILCLAAPGDTVLLSDRKTHHYTSIARIDRQVGHVYISDQRPERIFLKEGLNKVGIKAVIDGKFIRITHDEFRRVIVGLVTNDTIQLAEQYFQMNPPAKQDPMVYLAFAQTASGTGSQRFREPAIRLLEQGLVVATQASQKAQQVRIASKLHHLLLLSTYEAQKEGKLSDVQALSQRAQALEEHYSTNSLFDENTAQEFRQLGDALTNIGDYRKAIQFFDSAIWRDSSYEEAFLHRGMVKRLQGALDPAIADLSQALRLNDAALTKLTVEYERRQRNVSGDMKDNAEREVLARQRAQAFEERGKAFWLVNRCDEAIKDAKEFLAIKPNQSMGFYIVGMCDARAGRTESARTNLHRAMELEADPKKKTLMKDALDSLERTRD